MIADRFSAIDLIVTIGVDTKFKPSVHGREAFIRERTFIESFTVIFSFVRCENFLVERLLLPRLMIPWLKQFPVHLLEILYLK